MIIKILWEHREKYISNALEQKHKIKFFEYGFIVYKNLKQKNIYIYY